MSEKSADLSTHEKKKISKISSFKPLRLRNVTLGLIFYYKTMKKSWLANIIRYFSPCMKLYRTVIFESYLTASDVEVTLCLG